MRLIILATLIAFAFPKATLASETYDGNELFAQCTSSDDIEQLICVSFIRGAWHTYQFLTENQPEFISICLPPNSTLGQVRDVTIRFMTENPEYRHLEASAQVALALTKTWPCAAKD